MWINVSQTGTWQKSSHIVLMRIYAWAFHLDDNAFKIRCKHIPGHLDDHVIIGSSHRTVVPVCMWVCNHFAARPCYAECQRLMRKEERGQGNVQRSHLCHVKTRFPCTLLHIKQCSRRSKSQNNTKELQQAPTRESVGTTASCHVRDASSVNQQRLTKWIQSVCLLFVSYLYLYLAHVSLSELGKNTKCKNTKPRGTWVA